MHYYYKNIAENIKKLEMVKERKLKKG